MEFGLPTPDIDFQGSSCVGVIKMWRQMARDMFILLLSDGESTASIVQIGCVFAGTDGSSPVFRIDYVYEVDEKCRGCLEDQIGPSAIVRDKDN
jgi:hypothetical protein